LNGPKEIPVIVSQGTSAGLAPSSSMIRPVGGLGRPAPRGLILVQAQQTCGVLHLDLGTTTLNALGLTITTSPITLDISGNSGGGASARVMAEGLTGLLEAGHRRVALAGARRQQTPVSCRLFLSVPVRHGIQMLTPG